MLRTDRNPEADCGGTGGSSAPESPAPGAPDIAPDIAPAIAPDIAMDLAPDRTVRRVEPLVALRLVPPAERAAAAAAAAALPVAITPTMLAQAEAPPIARQFVPSAAELHRAADDLSDPIGDAAHSPVPGVVHRYPDRALLLPTHLCAVYCRFCFRRETVGDGVLSPAALGAALAYIRGRPEIWEVILTGGDPLVLSPRRLGDIVAALDDIPHVRVLRVHTRVPVVAPERIDAAMLRALRPRTPLYVALHINHAAELTAAGRAACAALADGGVPLLSQTVLLRGVNDSAAALEELFRALVELRVRPYYLHHLDRAPGTSHFRVPLSEGRALMRALRGRLSGIALPTYVLDIPGGHGKVPVGPDYLREGSDSCEVEDPWGHTHLYPEAMSPRDRRG